MSHSKLTSANLVDIVSCPSSKSYAARALIIAALTDRKIALTNLPDAKDTSDLIASLKDVGIEFLNDENSKSIQVKNSFPKCESHSAVKNLNVGEGGTTIRFLLPFLALGKAKYKLIFSGRMLERPMDELYSALRSLGVKVVETGDGVEVQGPIDFSKSAIVDCSRSSQFASGFEMIGSFYPVKVSFENLTLSKRYYEMTKSIVGEISAQDYYDVPVDFSCAGYFMAYAIFTRDLTIKNITKVDSFQADSVLVELLEQIGVNISISQKSGLSIQKINTSVEGLNLDGSNCIDLVPTLAFIASHIPKKSELSNISGLVHKESDRLLETLRILKSFSVEFEYDSEKDLLTIRGKKPQDYPSACENHFDAPNDHRMVMLAALFVKMRGGGTVSNQNSVKKSFPEFFSFFH